MTPDLFAMILAGHMLGDFIVQTDWMAANKEHVWKANIIHAVSYNLMMAALVLPFWHSWEAYVFLAISTGTHALFDRRWPTRWVLNVTHSKWFATQFWGVIATDQAIHISILAISYYLLAR